MGRDQDVIGISRAPPFKVNMGIDETWKQRSVAYVDDTGLR
jgi:hypothetical protein